jgi:HPt (histidine-containing phosphotransfer) domain-containing protein
MYLLEVHMRTTIELTEDQRAELLRLAAQRGMKGFSLLVQEAIDLFLETQSSRVSLINAAVAMKGSLQNKAADEFEARIKSIKENWR